MQGPQMYTYARKCWRNVDVLMLLNNRTHHRGAAGFAQPWLIVKTPTG